MLNLRSTLTLNNGVTIPRLGLGVYQSPAGDVTVGAVRAALAAGYRHIDTARIYGNEADVGRAVAESGVPRSEVFVTTKLWNSDQGHAKARAALEKSLLTLEMEYVDLYLLHWPVEKKRLESWKALEEALAEKKCRAIGVSNFTVAHLEELLARASVVPAVNQVEMSPFLVQDKLVRFCREHRIAVEAYSPLTQGKKLGDARAVAIAKAHGKSAAQVFIRWALQRDLVVIPKSVHKKRIEENAAVFDFELSDAEMKALDACDEDFRTCWDPTNVR